MSALRQLIIRLEKRRREAQRVKRECHGAKEVMADRHIAWLDSQLEMLSRADGKGRKSA